MKTKIVLLALFCLFSVRLQAQGVQMNGNVQMTMVQGTRLNMNTGSNTLSVGNNSTLNATGTINGNLTNDGTFNVGSPSSVGTVNINGTFINNAILNMELQNVASSQYDLILVNNTGVVAGTINLSYLAGYTLPAATNVDLIVTTGLTYSATENSPPTAPILDNATTVYVGLGVFLSATILDLKGERLNDEEVALAWKTSNELNNKGFEVEFSENAQNFQMIGFVEGKGNSIDLQHYQFKTPNTTGGYFRLKQIDFSGKTSYSNIVYVNGSEAMLVYPNPNNGSFYVEVGKNTQKLPARLFNTQGKEVWTGTLENNTNAVVTNLPTGVYLLQVVRNGKTKTVKIVVEK